MNYEYRFVRVRGGALPEINGEVTEGDRDKKVWDIANELGADGFQMVGANDAYLIFQKEVPYALWMPPAVAKADTEATAPAPVLTEPEAAIPLTEGNDYKKIAELGLGWVPRFNFEFQHDPWCPHLADKSKACRCEVHIYSIWGGKHRIA